MLRVAILDSSAIARALLRTILSNGGYHVISESGPVSANLARLSLLAPQLVFIALDVENDDALSILRNVRSSMPKAIIFAMSSAFTAEIIKQATKEGANGFVVKPFNGLTVLASVRSSILKLVKQQTAQTKI